jgi:hypothetical protein
VGVSALERAAALLWRMKVRLARHARRVPGLLEVLGEVESV